MIGIAAEKALEHFGAAPGRDPRAVVLHADDAQPAGLRIGRCPGPGLCFDAGPQGHPAARRHILDGVVEQVADSLAQQHDVAQHGYRRHCGGACQRRPRFETEIEPLRERARYPFRAGVEGQGHQVQACRRAQLIQRHAVLGARQGQQLVGQAHSTVGAGLQFEQGRACLFECLRVDRAIGMQLERGQRRAQLVRGIGDEGALGFQRIAQARQQRIHGVDQGLQLGRHAFGGFGRQRRYRLRALPVEGVGQGL